MSRATGTAEAVSPGAFWGIGAALGLGILWAMARLPGEWLVALALGFVFLFLVALSRGSERFLLGLLFFMIPINPDFRIELARYASDPSVTNGNTPMFNLSCIDIVLAMLYVLWVSRLLTSRGLVRVVWPAGAWLVLGLISWGALSMANASDPILSLLMLGHFAKAFLLFFYLANHLRAGEDLWLAARCLVAGLAVQSLITCAQYAAGNNFGLEALGERAVRKEMELDGERIFRVGGTVGHPNALGGYLGSVLPLVLAVGLVPTLGRWRGLFFGGLGAGTLALVLTFCRSGWLAGALACAGVIVWLFRHARRRVRWGRILASCLLLGIILAAFAPRIAARWLQDDRGSTSSRIPQTKIALEMIQQHPFLGVGLNNYSRVQHLYDTYVEAPSRLHRVYLHQGRLHNIFVSLAAEMGLVSLLFLGAFLWVVVGRARRLLRGLQGDLRTQMILLGVMLGLGARILHDAAHTGHLAMTPLFWIYAAMLAAPVLRRSPESAVRRERAAA